MKHGVIVTAGKVQPYAVWVRGEVVLFTSSRKEADKKLHSEEKRLTQGRTE